MNDIASRRKTGGLTSSDTLPSLTGERSGKLKQELSDAEPSALAPNCAALGSQLAKAYELQDSKTGEKQGHALDARAAAQRNREPRTNENQDPGYGEPPPDRFPTYVAGGRSGEQKREDDEDRVVERNIDVHKQCPGEGCRPEQCIIGSSVTTSYPPEPDKRARDRKADAEKNCNAERRSAAMKL